MKPIYFPFTYISEPVLEALSAFFKQIIVYQPSSLNIPESMQKQADSGLLEIRIPVNGDENKIDNILKDYKSWANIHQGSEMAFFKTKPDIIPFFGEFSTSQIKADIKKKKQKQQNEKKQDSLLNARIFLHMAQEFDLQNLEINKALLLSEEKTLDLIDNLKGEDEDELSFKGNDREKILKTINENAPVNLNKGNVIADGISDELDELRAISTSGKDYLNKMLERETERTGISSLKIAFNNVFGYYIEVRNTHKDKVPEEWIRKQTLVSAERYITEELKEYETKILGAQEKIGQLEQTLFNELLQFMLNYISPVQKNAQIIAQIDCLSSFSKNAIDNNYIRPLLDDSTDLEIKNGRHPVIEKQLPTGEEYIANDLVLNRNQQQIIMITGQKTNILAFFR